MSHSVEISNILDEASRTGEVLKISYSGYRKLTAKVGQIGTGWVELTTFDDGMKRDGERWLKIALIDDIGSETPQSESPEPLAIR